jgi:hypothetical protein
MPWSRMAFWALTAGMAAVTNAQASGWATGQVNATMCAWQNPRGKFGYPRHLVNLILIPS